MSGEPGVNETELDRLRHPDEARATVLAQAKPLPVEWVPLIDAPWRVLGEDLRATEDAPPFAAATMDGFAVVADDGSPWREVIGEQTAGFVLDLDVTLGTAIRITTGSPVPRGADAVVPVEETEETEDHVVMQQGTVPTGSNIRPIGADLRKGDLVLAEGSILGPAETALVASLGMVPVPVRRQPRAAVLSTGDELVEPGDLVGPGQIRDANRFGLVAALIEAGAVVSWTGRAPDQRDGLRRLLADLLGEHDLVITSGGVSMGELDLIKGLLGELATVHFRRVFMKPGKPLNFATAGKTLIFGLPGNPVSALVGFEMFVRPAIGRMLGKRAIDRPRLKVRLGRETSPTDRIEYQRARVVLDQTGRLVATTTGGQASSRLASLVGANALLVVPPSLIPYPVGAEVEAIMLGSPLAESD